RVARVSRLTRQIRYYAEAERLASDSLVNFGLAGARECHCRTVPRLAPMHKTPLQTEWRFAVLHWSLASETMWTVVVSTAPFADSLGRFPLWGPLRRRLLLPGVCVLWLSGGHSSSLHITGVYLVSNLCAVCLYV